MMNKIQIQALMSGFKEDYQPLADALYHLLLGDKGSALIKVLQTYQNEDGGFGHGLEADIQMPHSSVAATDLAMVLLDQVTDPSKDNMIQDAIRFYNSVFDAKTLSFPLAPPQVDEYPHAIWWNYKDIDSFSYGNPNPEILGTLLQYKDYVTIDLAAFQEQVLSYIEEHLPQSNQFHVLLSTLHLYERSDITIRNRLESVIKQACQNMVVLDSSKWVEYGLEPYKVFLTAPSLFGTAQPGLDDSIKYLEQQLEQGPMKPNWSWYQYDEVFEQVKEHWSILLTFDAIRAVLAYRKQ